MYQWCGFKSRRGKNKNLTALKSNSNTVWFNFQTYIYKLSFNNKQCCPTDINQRVGGQDFEKPSLNITKKRYHKIRMYNNVKSWLYYPHDNTCCTKNWIVTPVLRGHLWNKQTKTDAIFVWHASFSFIGWPSTINHLFSDIFFITY